MRHCVIAWFGSTGAAWHNFHLLPSPAWPRSMLPHGSGAQPSRRTKDRTPMKNALLVVVAFALGAGAVWYFNGNHSDGGAAQRGGPAAAGGARGAPGGFAGR